MISSVFRFTAFICCALVVVSFALFARDQTAGASAHQQSELVAGTGARAPGAAPGRHHDEPRRIIDRAAKVLTAPFDAIVQSSNQWVRRGLPTVFALLVYGVGLGLLARHLGDLR